MYSFIKELFRLYQFTYQFFSEFSIIYIMSQLLFEYWTYCPHFSRRFSYKKLYQRAIANKWRNETQQNKKKVYGDSIEERNKTIITERNDAFLST